MTVAELIAKLSEFDGGLEVYTYEEHGDYVKAVEVSDFIAYEYDDYDDNVEREIKAVFVG